MEASNPGVVHEDIHAAEGGRDGLERGLDSARVGDIQSIGLDVGLTILDIVSGGLGSFESLNVDVDQGERCTCIRQGNGDGAANAVRATSC